MTLAGALLDAEAKIGEMLKELPKAQGERTDIEPSCTAATKLETKESAVKRLGFEKTQAYSSGKFSENAKGCFVGASIR